MDAVLVRNKGTYQKCLLISVVLIALTTGCAERPASVEPAAPHAVSQVTPPDTALPLETPILKRMETVLSEKLLVRSEPSKGGTVVAKLRKGESVEVKQQREKGWVNIVTPEGIEGWVYGGSLTGFPELPRPNQSISRQKKPAQKSVDVQAQGKERPKAPVSDALDSEIKAGKKAARPDDSVVDQPGKSMVDDAKVTGKNP
jgi:hypothetical protein